MRFDDLEKYNLIEKAKEGKLTPPEELWSGIEKELLNKKKRRGLFWLWYGAGGLVLILSTLFIGLNIENNDEVKSSKASVNQSIDKEKLVKQFNYGKSKIEKDLIISDFGEEVGIKKEGLILANKETKGIKNFPQTSNQKKISNIGQDNFLASKLNPGIEELSTKTISKRTKDELLFVSNMSISSPDLKTIQIIDSSFIKDLLKKKEDRLFKKKKIALELGANSSFGRYRLTNNIDINLLGKSIGGYIKASYHQGKNKFFGNLDYTVVYGGEEYFISSNNNPTFAPAISVPPSLPDTLLNKFTIQEISGIIGYGYRLFEKNRLSCFAEGGIGAVFLSRVNNLKKISSKNNYFPSIQFQLGLPVYYKLKKNMSVLLAPRIKKDALQTSNSFFVRDRLMFSLSLGLNIKF